ncbi:MAG: ferrochelatase, partial [Deltaproteobacteria bacterium]|nr:ferrochelatase [Deltaproteobacteria bacterium]
MSDPKTPEAPAASVPETPAPTAPGGSAVPAQTEPRPEPAAAPAPSGEPDSTPLAPPASASSSHSYSDTSPLGLLLLDIGAPANVDDVPAFLRRLYRDPYVLQHSFSGLFLDLVAMGLAFSRQSGVKTALKAIGGTAPDEVELEKLASALALGLAERLEAPVRPFVAFRHSGPALPQILEKVRGAGCRRVVGMFARTFSSPGGSRSMRVELSLCGNDFPDLDLSMIDGFESEAGVRQAFAVEALAALEGVPLGERPEAHLMFLLQGQPVKGGTDPALPRAQAFAAAVHEAMGVRNPFSLAYQNGVDPRATLMPEAAEEIERLASEKRRALVLIPLSHACEGLATRWELDVALVEIARAAGFAHVRRARAPAGSAQLRSALVALLQRHLAEM